MRKSRIGFLSVLLAVVMVVGIFGVGVSRAGTSEGFLVSVEFGEGCVNLAWEAVEGADFYSIYRGDSIKKISRNTLTDFPIIETSFSDFGNFEKTDKFAYVVVALNRELEVIAKSKPVEISKEDTGCILNLAFTVGEKTYLRNREIVDLIGGEVSVIDGKLYVPFRALPEELEYKLVWNGKERKVTINNSHKTIEMWVAKSTAIVDGEQIEIDPYDDRVVSRIVNGYLHCPLLFLAKHMGAKNVKIDPVEKTIEMDFNCPEKYVEPDVFYDRVVEMVVGNNIIKVDEIEYDVGVSTKIIDGKTNIPTEQVLKAFGFLTKWENENELHFSRWNYEDKEKKVELAGIIVVGSNQFFLDGEKYNLEYPAKMVESNMFTSLNILDQIGASLAWVGATKTIIFTMPVPEDAMVDLKNPSIFTRKAEMWYVSEEHNTDKSKIIRVDGKDYVAAGDITIINGRTFAPVKTVALVFGADVSWNENEEQMVIEMSRVDADNAIASIRVAVQAGEKEYAVGDETFEMIEAPVMEDGIMYVAIRLFSEALGLDVGWNAEERAVIWTAKVSKDTKIKLEEK